MSGPRNGSSAYSSAATFWVSVGYPGELGLVPRDLHQGVRGDSPQAELGLLDAEDQVFERYVFGHCVRELFVVPALDPAHLAM